MPAGARNSLLDQIEDLEDPVPRDFDPEDERLPDSDDDSDEGGQDDHLGRDHYEKVGKSKLRKPEQITLGPQYAGARVSRDAVEVEDDDDPFAVRADDSEEEEHDSEDDLEVDVGIEGADQPSSDESEMADDHDGNSEGSEEQDDEEPSASDLSEDEEAAAAQPRPTALPDALTVSKLLAQDRTAVAAPLSQAAKVDADKGRAVKRQRTTFDNLLNVRIKLQKALIGANTLARLAEDEQDTEQDPADVDTAYRAAETAAFSLWSSLTSLRDGLSSARSGRKRSHLEFTSATPTASLWQHTRSQDAIGKPFQDGTLDKWHARTHAAEAVTQAAVRARTSAGVGPTTAHALLATALADSTHLARRARTPRSCAPYQLRLAASKPTKRARGPDDAHVAPDLGDETVYDDADFYAVLLAALLEQRSAGGSAAGAGIDVAALDAYKVRREAKTRRVDVDAKASKGRKLRYAVHEKLLNYCAPEDRGGWGDRQVDELFGSLLGRRIVMDEEGGGEEEEGEVEGGLLFG